MEKPTFEGKVQSLISQRNVFAFVIAALSISLAVQSITFYRQKQRIVVVPTTGPSFWLEKDRVSKNYLRDFGTFISTLLLSRTPKDVSWKNAQILENVHPSFHGSVKKALDQERAEMIKNQSTFLFEHVRSESIEKTLQFVVQGVQKTYIDREGKNTTLLQKENKKYTLSFICEEGRVYLKNIKQQKGIPK